MAGMPDGERPVWLPEEWTMKVVKRVTGKIDRYYTSPLSGYTCRSKAEVMRCMDIIKDDVQPTRPTSFYGDTKQKMAKQLASQATRSTSCFEDNKQHPTVQFGNYPEWLPSGWIVEIKTQKSGTGAGRKYKCYFDPFTGSRFYSKRQVFRHLESGELCNPIANKKRSIKTKSAGDICISSNQRGSIHNKFADDALVRIEYSSDGLPHGWIKETRIRNTDSHRVRKDPYYVDPVSGYVFRSRKDVFHYIETGEIGKYAFMPKKTRKSSMYSSAKDEPVNTSISAKRRIPRGTAVRRCLFSGQVSNSNLKMLIETDELSEKTDLPPQSHPSAQGMEGIESSCLTPSDIKHLRKEIENQLDPASHGDASFPPVSKKPLSKATVDHCERKNMDMLSEKVLNIPTCLQEGNEELPVPGDKLLEQRPLELTGEVLPQPAHRKVGRPRKKRRGRKKQGNEDQGGTENQGGVVQLRPRNTKAFKAITLPVRSSKRLAGIQADPGMSDLSRRAMAKKSEQLEAQLAQVSNQSTRSHQALGGSDELKAVPINNLESLEKLEGKELPEQQATPAEQVGARKLSEDRPGSPLILPFGDSWSDPCLEFAFRTLTGDIPVLEDTAAIEDYFQQQLSSVQSPSLSGPTTQTFSSSVNLGQPELHAQTPVHLDRRAFSLKNGLQSGANASNR